MCVSGPLLAGQLEFNLSDLLLLLLFFYSILIIIGSEDQLFGLLLQIGHAHVIGYSDAIRTSIFIAIMMVCYSLLNAVTFSHFKLASFESLFHEGSWGYRRRV